MTTRLIYNVFDVLPTLARCSAFCSPGRLLLGYEPRRGAPDGLQGQRAVRNSARSAPCRRRARTAYQRWRLRASFSVRGGLCRSPRALPVFRALMAH